MLIETERLTLREFAAGDWPTVLAYRSDPRYLRCYDRTGRTSAEARTRFQLAIETRTERHLIGNCGVRLVALGSCVADIGYELAPDEWGHGYVTEAACAIVAFGFDTLGLHRIAATCVADNAASAHVLEKLGLRREGQLREVARYKGAMVGRSGLWHTRRRMAGAALKRLWPTMFLVGALLALRSLLLELVR